MGEGREKRVVREALGPPDQHPPLNSLSASRKNLQQKGGPRHEVSLGVAKIQGEGR